jgi:hypothetical protein
LNVAFSPSSSRRLLQEPDPLFLSWWDEDFLQWESYIIAESNGEYSASVHVYGSPVKVNTEIIMGHVKVFESGKSEFKLPFHLNAHTAKRAIVRIRLSTAIVIAAKSKIKIVMDVKGIQYPYFSVSACNFMEDLQEGQIFTSTVTVSSAMAKQGGIHKRTGDRLVVGDFAEIAVEFFDAFGNAAGLTDPRLSLRSVVDSAGTSESLSNEFFAPNIVHFTRTLAGAYNVHISLIAWIGLSATYFASPSLAFPISSRTGAVIDFSASDSQQLQGSLAIGMPFSVRWAGFIRSSLAQIFTIYAGVCAADERIRLWIDNNLVVDMWQSLSGTASSGIANFDEADRFYDIKVEYRQLDGCARAKLSWSRDASIKPISAEDLGLEELSANNPLSFTFWADAASIFHMKLIGSSLTLGTSCAENSFTIRARDQYGNIAKLSDENMKVRISPSSLLGNSLWHDAPDIGEIHPMCGNPSSEICIVNYKPKASGNFLLSIELKQPNFSGNTDWLAVRGTPLELLILPGPPQSFVVNGISMISAGAMSEFTIFASDCGSSRIDLRKFVSPLSIMASQGESWQRVTSHVKVAGDWALNAQYQVTSSGTLFISVLFYGLHIGASPFAVHCSPGSISGQVSMVTISLSITTAGILQTMWQLFAVHFILNGCVLMLFAVFVGTRIPVAVHLKDRYGNPAQIDSTTVIVGSLCQSSWPCQAHVTAAESGQDPYEGHSLILFWTQSGKFSLAANIQPLTLGLFATYYATENLSQPVSSASVSVLDFSREHGLQPPGSLPSSRPFSVRWSGFFRPYNAQLYTVYAGVSSADDRIRVWIDSSLVVDMWWNLSGTEGSGTVNLAGGIILSNVVVEYKQSVGAMGASLRWYGSIIDSDEESGGQFMYHQVSDSISRAFDLTVVAGPICVATSSIRGSGLTIATAGQESVFTVVPRDQFYNIAPTKQFDILMSRDNIDKVDIIPSIELPSLEHEVRFVPHRAGTGVSRVSVLQGGGLWATYYDGILFNKPKISIWDKNLDHVWGTSSPGFGLPADYFSVRWSGYLTPPNENHFVAMFGANQSKDVTAASYVTSDCISLRLSALESHKICSSNSSSLIKVMNRIKQRHSISLEYQAFVGDAGCRLALAFSNTNWIPVTFSGLLEGATALMGSPTSLLV